MRQMEAEVIAMTAAMLHGGLGSSAPDVCGAMTSGTRLVWFMCCMSILGFDALHI
jgi:glutamate/tyrosine decarboxylase-like PLP-dependent enzyme